MFCYVNGHFDWLCLSQLKIGNYLDTLISEHNPNTEHFRKAFLEDRGSDSNQNPQRHWSSVLGQHCREVKPKAEYALSAEDWCEGSTAGDGLTKVLVPPCCSSSRRGKA
jgi:hypothetical protein